MQQLLQAKVFKVASETPGAEAGQRKEVRLRLSSPPAEGVFKVKETQHRGKESRR
jgi:hypothetical protein